MIINTSKVDISQIIRDVCNSSEFDRQVQTIVRNKNFWEAVMEDFKISSLNKKIEHIEDDVRKLRNDTTITKKIEHIESNVGRLRSADTATKSYVQEHIANKIKEHSLNLPQDITNFINNNIQMSTILNNHTTLVMNGIAQTATQTLTALISHPDFNEAINKYLCNADRMIQEKTSQFMEHNEGTFATSLRSHDAIAQKLISDTEKKIEENIKKLVSDTEKKIEELSKYEEQITSLKNDVSVLKSKMNDVEREVTYLEGFIFIGCLLGICAIGVYTKVRF